MQGLMLHAGASNIGRQDLPSLPTPEATDTHKPIAHARVVQGIIEALAYRKLEVVRDEYGVSKDGMRMFGFIEVNIKRDGINLGIACRNANDKAFALGMVAGYRTLCCDNLAFHGDFMAITRKHSKTLEAVLQDVISTGVDRVQRQFEPMMAQVDAWRNYSLSDTQAKEIVYDAFVSERVDCPKHLMRVVDKHYFQPEHEEFKPRTVYSLQNAFTSAFRELDPIPMYRATSSAGEYFAAFQ